MGEAVASTFILELSPEQHRQKRAPLLVLPCEVTEGVYEVTF